MSFMKDNKKQKSKYPGIESTDDLKKQTTATNGLKKGYNEKNPVQPQGAFKPDSDTRLR